MEAKSGPPAKSFTIEDLLRDEERSTANKEEKPQKRRQRSSFSAVQVHFLEMEFCTQRYISPESRARLASALGLTQQQIKIWFQNRRYKSKPKSHNEQTAQRCEENLIRPQALMNGMVAHPQCYPNANFHWLQVYYNNMCYQNAMRSKLS